MMHKTTENYSQPAYLSSLIKIFKKEYVPINQMSREQIFDALTFLEKNLRDYMIRLQNHDFSGAEKKEAAYLLMAQGKLTTKVAELETLEKQKIGLFSEAYGLKIKSADICDDTKHKGYAYQSARWDAEKITSILQEQDIQFADWLDKWYSSGIKAATLLTSFDLMNASICYSSAGKACNVMIKKKLRDPLDGLEEMLALQEKGLHCMYAYQQTQKSNKNIPDKEYWKIECAIHFASGVIGKTYDELAQFIELTHYERYTHMIKNALVHYQKYISFLSQKPNWDAAMVRHIVERRTTLKQSIPD